MKTMKKLHVAAAAAALLATMGGVHAATVSQSGGTLAMETIIPTTGATTRVRAPAITYSYANGPSAQANGTQKFHVMFTLGGGDAANPPYWAGPGTTPNAPALTADPANFNGTSVRAMGLNVAATAQTITAKLRGALNATRVPVVGSEAAVGANQYAIVLNTVSIGQTLAGTNLAVHPADNRTIIYTFTLVNRTPVNVALSDLDITFNTSKQAGAPTDYYRVAGQATSVVDVTTDEATAEYASIHNLASLVTPTTGHVTAFLGTASCNTDTVRSVTVRGNSGINDAQGTEEFTNIGGNVPVLNTSYIVIRRATEMGLGRGPTDRLIAVTNSFSTNFGANPTNGVGGTGGGRYTFKPTQPAQATITFNAGENPTVTANAAGATGLGQVTATTPGNIRSISQDERDMTLGFLGFRNISTVSSDRAVLNTTYQFQGGAAGDFSTPNSANILGRVDIEHTNGPAVRITAAYSGGFAEGSVFRLVRFTQAVPNCVVAREQATGGAAAVITRTADNGSSFNFDIPATALAAAAGTTAGVQNSLAGEFAICYSIPGTTNVPSLRFGAVNATLFKDDSTEQTLTACPSTFSGLSGGVKIDVRNFAMSYSSGANTDIYGILRIINNSETDPARVDAQYIWNDGAYGNWGTLINNLPPRGAAYVTDSQVAAALSTAPNPAPVVNGVALYPIRPGVPTDLVMKGNNPAVNGAGNIGGRQVVDLQGANSIRLRISADVSTLRVQNYIYDRSQKALVEVSSSQGADFVNIESSNRDHLDQDAQTDIKR